MAKSPVGGSRAYLKGRIGSDVYSLGKDGKGKRQQVVRALAEEVANPRTENQMFGRMIMTTVMQAVKALSTVIDHSFDGVAKGQPSISEFIRRNYALVKADALANPASGNVFGLNKYHEKGIKVGKFVVSSGKVALPSAVSADSGALDIQLSADTLTVGGLKAALGLSADGYLTLIQIEEGGVCNIIRAQLTTELPDNTAITAGNVASLFTLEGNVPATVALDDNIISIGSVPLGNLFSRGVIVSEKVNGAWKHSSCALTLYGTPAFNADTALPTYPVGVEQFLNGGDI